MQEKKDKFSSIFTILALYFVPIFSWILLSHAYMAHEAGFFIAIGGITLLCLGATLLYLVVQRSSQPLVLVREVAVPTPQPSYVPPQEAEEPQIDHTIPLREEIAELERRLSEKASGIGTLQDAYADNERECEDLRMQLQALKQDSESSIEKYRTRADEMELSLHQKQQMVEQLETQINDLRYEIKTLLQLTEVDYSKFVMEPARDAIPSSTSPVFQGVVKREEEAKVLLKRCIDIAQRISSGYRSGSQGLSLIPSALDLRRLIDALKEESGALILLYDPKEKKTLYASKEAKNLLGWAPETLAHDFQEIAEEGFTFWERAVEQLDSKPQSTLVIGLKTKGGEERPFNAFLSGVSSGIFRSYAIAVLFANG